ncbi:MAG: type II toxin-antitoxin system PemK/MazF family toxin [Clostridiales bacterium]|nr:type II toxin-antitoxin system PemK/MazF family toxin [Clostridiales bacterium]
MVLEHPVLVVSNNFFNQSGMALVCPILKNAVEGPLHIQLKESPVESKNDPGKDHRTY